MFSVEVYLCASRIFSGVFGYLDHKKRKISVGSVDIVFAGVSLIGPVSSN